MNNNIKELERMLKNIVYAEILNYPRFIKQSTNDVWGKYVIRTYQDTKGEYQEDRNELENWYYTITLTKDIKLDKIIEECKKTCQEKDNQNFTSVEEAKNYTCHQLCDWRWLENESGQIIREVYTSDGVKYQATLVKYAKVLKDFECVQDGINKMSEYKRLTKRHENGYIELMCNSCKYNDKCDVETHYCNEAVKNRLAELEDDLESGKLVRLPCRVGDTVYCVYYFDDVEEDFEYDIIPEEVCIRNIINYFEK